MHTYSHLIHTAWLRWALNRSRSRSPVPLAFVCGSFLPDIPLILLTAGWVVRRRLEQGPDSRIFGPEYDQLFFHDPLWIVSHNLLHAPLVIAVGIGLGLFLRARRPARLWLRLRWFFAGCGLHSLVDIATHHHDGPLLLFPFDLSLRFASPLSYWDPRHHAAAVSLAEHAIDLLALVAMLGPPVLGWLRRLHSRRVSRQTG